MSRTSEGAEGPSDHHSNHPATTPSHQPPLHHPPPPSPTITSSPTDTTGTDDNPYDLLARTTTRATAGRSAPASPTLAGLDTSVPEHSTRTRLPAGASPSATTR